MKRIRISIGILTIALVTLTATSCRDTKKENNNEDGHHPEMESEDGQHNEEGEMHHDTTMKSSNDMMDAGQNTAKSTILVVNYLKLKDALVADDKEGAAKAGGTMVTAFNNFDTSSFTSEQQKELKDIIDDAKEHAEHIEKSPIDHQREHFDVLSKDMIDLIAITGTEEKLYQDFCPMYNNNKGAQWLSTTKEIKNPYYGAKMMSCGSIQKEIN
ncbi:DUF3347 domain-containing protein [Flavobacteriaceae bacterium KMM 6897]|nr:DUF3347 domain-containing protein [Flavobacteriaceae bacterium KMM 6897]MEB8344500.1 DUF3347 domain-containing protein [Flavobacteriaceae bacterium KMM 6898]